MNQKSKKFMTLGLALSAIGIWVPQLLVGVVDTSPIPRADVPNNGAPFGGAMPGLPPGAGDGTAGEGSAMPVGIQAPQHGSAATTGESSSGTSLAEALSQANQQVGLHMPVTQRVDLSELLGTFGSARGSLSPMTGQNEHGASGIQMGHYSAISPQAQLANYCRDNALSAIIYGDGGGVAMIGGTLVHPGDVLPEGIRVTGIERRSVSLSLRGATQDMGLPAFEARERSGTQPQQETTESTPGNETTSAPDNNSVPGAN